MSLKIDASTQTTERVYTVSELQKKFKQITYWKEEQEKVQKLYEFYLLRKILF